MPPDGAQINNPAPGNWLWGKIEKPAPNRTIVRVIVDTTGIEYINHVINDAWFGWIPYATAIPPQEYDFPLSDRLHPGSRSVYSKNQFGQVHVHGAVSAGDSTIGWDQAIGTLPEGYRPSVAMEFCASFAVDGVNCAGAVSISTDGLIKAYPDVATPQKVVYFDVVFLATSK